MQASANSKDLMGRQDAEAPRTEMKDERRKRKEEKSLRPAFVVTSILSRLSSLALIGLWIPWRLGALAANQVEG